MALFSSSKKESTQSLRRINPTVMQSYSVGKDMVDFAKRNSVELSTLDFNILDIRTYKRIGSTSENSWEEIMDTTHIHLDINSEILNQAFEIKQLYEIEIFSKDSSVIDFFSGFHTAIGANASKCKVYLSIKESSILRYFPNFEKELLKHINKSKIKAGIFIHIFDEMLDGVVSKLSAKVKVDGELRFDKNENILVAEAYEPTPTIDDKLINYFEEKKEQSEEDRVDHINRGFLKTTSIGDVLIEYIKPRVGKAGRNAKGEFIKPSEPIVKNVPTFDIDDSIEKVEDENKILYKAKVNGYIQKEANRYVIKSEMDLSKLDFRSTGSIVAGIDSDVVLNVQDSSWEEDAIGDGMEIVVSEVNTKGNVGQNSSIKAKKVTIGGQTHKNSSIEANEIDINIHKGSATGENVRVTRLENGVIKAKNVKVTQAIGGIIEAGELEIEICMSMLKASASKKIVINKLQGKDNVFTIDPLVQSDEMLKFEKNGTEILELQTNIRDIDKDIQKHEKIVVDNQVAFNDVKKRIIYYKQNNIKIPAIFIERYRGFLKLQETLESLKLELVQKKEKLELLNAKSKSFQESIFKARIINKDRWSGQDTIVFRLIDPEIELSFIPPEGYQSKVFGVVVNKDGVYEIQGVNE